MSYYSSSPAQRSSHGQSHYPSPSYSSSSSSSRVYPPQPPYGQPPYAPLLRPIPLPTVDGNGKPYSPLHLPYALPSPTSTPEYQPVHTVPHSALSSRSTIIQYDFAEDPSTLRMSSSSHSLFTMHDPVSSPPVFFLRIELETSDQTITIRQSRPITCGDVIARVHAYLAQRYDTHSSEWRSMDSRHRDSIKAAYTQRTGRAYDRDTGIRRIDLLRGRTIFKRLVPDTSDTSGTTWILQTLR